DIRDLTVTGVQTCALPITQSAAGMREDSIDRWRTETRLATNAIEMRSWDYRARQVRDVGAAGRAPVELASRDIPGVYAYTSREQIGRGSGRGRADVCGRGW